MAHNLNYNQVISEATNIMNYELVVVKVVVEEFAVPANHHNSLCIKYLRP
jgi:hypothetical protein